MKSALLLAVMTLAVSHAQAPRKQLALSPPVAITETERIPQGMLAHLEQIFDSRLTSANTNDPLDIIGGTRGLYVEGVGTVFTTELSLAVTPGLYGLVSKTPGDDTKAKIHQRKLAHIPQLEDVMKDLMKVSALTLVPMRDTEKVVYAVRLRYLIWEDTTGLPAQILMTADKKAATQGDIKTKVE